MAGLSIPYSSKASGLNWRPRFVLSAVALPDALALRVEAARAAGLFCSLFSPVLVFAWLGVGRLGISGAPDFGMSACAGWCSSRRRLLSRSSSLSFEVRLLSRLPS